MFEKGEPQFFGKSPLAEIEEGKKEAPKEGEEIKPAEFSKEEGPLVERRRDYLKEKVAEVEKILAEEKETTLEKKSGAVRNYLEKSFIKKEVIEPSFHREEKEATSKLFLDLTPDKLEARLGKEDLNLIFRVISERDRLLGQMKEDNLTEEELRKFVEQNSYEMLPWRIHKILVGLNDVSAHLEARFLWDWEMSEWTNWKKDRKYLDSQLKASLVDLRRENQEWQKYLKFDRKKEEKPMGIKGFEKLDSLAGKRKGKELVRVAVETLPRGILSANVKSIEYDGKRKQLDRAQYGFDGESAASFISDNDGKGDIVFHKPSDFYPPAFWNDFSSILGHEWGHSLDPRLADQKDLTLGEQFRMIKDWERVRAKEEEWSSYVKKINKLDKKEEESEKSTESFAESIALFLNNPFTCKELYPQRYKFGVAWLKRRFPGFDPVKHLQAQSLFYRFMNKE